MIQIVAKRTLLMSALVVAALHGGSAFSQHVASVKPQDPVKAFSASTRFGDSLYVSGTIGIDAVTGQVPESFESEVETCLQNLRATLRSAGMDFEDLVSVQVYLTDISLWARLNTVYVKLIPPPLPSRVAVGVTGLAVPRARLEVSAVARKKAPGSA